MSRPSEDDREAVDRAFADLVAGYHLTSDRPDPLQDRSLREPAGELAPTTTDDADPAWADEHPLFRFPDPATEPVAAEEPDTAEEQFVPEPPMPLPRPAWPALLAWIAMGYAVLAVLAAAVGVHLPRWAGWVALVGFIGGFGVLVTRLPRHRPPDAGNGAVL